MNQKAQDIKDKCYDILGNVDLSQSNYKRKEIIMGLLEDILDREVLLDIKLFFNDDGTHITNREYGAILVSRLVEDLAQEYL